MSFTKIVYLDSGSSRGELRSQLSAEHRLGYLRGVFAAAAVFVTFFIGFVGCVPQPGGSSGEKAKEKATIFYQTGIKYLAEGKTPQAVKELTEAEKLTPENADVQHALGLAFQQSGEYDKAQEQYEKTLKLDPKLTEARNNLGTVLIVKGKFDEAIGQFEQCVKDLGYSTPEKAWYNLGIAHFHQKDLDKAIYHYEKALQVRGDNVNALYNLGFCHESKEEFSKALGYYRQALKFDPMFKDALLRVGVVMEKTKQYREGLQSVKRALDIDSDFLPAHLEMGILLARLGKTDEALRKFELVMKTDPKGPLGQKANEEIGLLGADKFKGIPKEALR